METTVFDKKRDEVLNAMIAFDKGMRSASSISSRSTRMRL